MEMIRKSLELCWEIEKLPASEQQTKISQMANELRKEIENFEQPKPLCPECSGTDIDRIHQSATFATPEYSYWQCAECECQWGKG